MLRHAAQSKKKAQTKIAETVVANFLHSVCMFSASRVQSKTASSDNEPFKCAPSLRKRRHFATTQDKNGWEMSEAWQN